jgi:hypothetical protein
LLGRLDGAYQRLDSERTVRRRIVTGLVRWARSERLCGKGPLLRFMNEAS